MVKVPRDYIHKWPWDILIILDACRRDYFMQYNRIEGSLKPIEVETAYTTAWLKTYFPDRYPYVWVSGNPVVNSGYPVQGYRPWVHIRTIINVWKHEWREDLLTVPPEAVTKWAIPWLGRRKVVVHYIQPHFPGIGKSRIRMVGWKPSKPCVTVKLEEERTPEKAQTAYRENLEIVLREVEENLLPRIPPGRRVVITSDHGELLGEEGFYGHPGRPEDEEDIRGRPKLWKILTEVFWFEVSL